MLKLVAIFVSRRTYPRWYSNRHFVVLFWNKVLWRLFGDCGWVALSVRERPAPLKYCQLFTKLLGQLVHQTFQNMDFIFSENGISLSIFMAVQWNVLWLHFGNIWVALSHIPLKSKHYRLAKNMDFPSLEHWICQILWKCICEERVAGLLLFAAQAVCCPSWDVKLLKPPQNCLLPKTFSSSSSKWVGNTMMGW